MRPAQRFYVSRTPDKGVYRIATPAGVPVVERATEPLRDLALALTQDGVPDDTPLEVYYLGRDDTNPTRPTFVTLQQLAGDLKLERPPAAEPVAKGRRREA